jgi:hypothetical protein
MIESRFSAASAQVASPRDWTNSQVGGNFIFSAFWLAFPQNHLADSLVATMLPL